MKSFGHACLAGIALVAVSGSCLLAQTPALDPAKPASPPRVRVSPHETSSTVIGERGGPRVMVVYGRPGTKDPKTGEVRRIWGGLVPWDQPWRLGADEATVLISPVPLKFGSVTIPAGAHALYLVPSESGETRLAFSRSVVKSGAPVDEGNDVARVGMTRHALETPVDQLIIAIEGDAAGNGLIKIAWERTQFTAAFTVSK